MTTSEALVELDSAAVAIRHNAGKALQRWESLTAEERDRIMMELRHDFQDGLKSVQVLSGEVSA